MSETVQRSAREKIRHVLSFDGTWQRGDQKNPTNIKLIHDSIEEFDVNGLRQVAKHFDGVATRGNKLTRWFNGVTGADLPKIVCEAYEYLSQNYQPGDEIVMTGYSRGAFIARTLNGMMYNVGIIDPSKFDSQEKYREAITEAYDVYRDSDASPDSARAQKFIDENSFAERPIVNHMALFDTVGQLGVPFQFPIFHKLTRGRFDFHDTKVNPNTLSVSHVIAIDEKRKNFVPTLIEKINGERTEIREVYFAGDHSAVGGGSEDNKGLSDITGLWSINEMREQGNVAFNLNKVKELFDSPDVSTNEDATFRLSGVFSLVAKPFIRDVPKGAEVHSSVGERAWKLGDKYEPVQLVGERLNTLVAQARSASEKIIAVVSPNVAIPSPS